MSGESIPAVLYFSSGAHVQGGAAQNMYRMTSWLKQQGGRPVAVLPHKGSLVDWYTRKGIDVRIIPFVRMRRSLSPVYLLRYFASTVSMIVTLVRLIRREAIDIVHVNEILYWPALIAGRIAGVKTICHTRMIIERPRWVWRALVMVANRWSDVILCVSQAVMDSFGESRRGIARMLYDGGPELERFDPTLARYSDSVRQNLGIEPSSRVVGLVSKLVLPKGHLELVKAAREVRCRRPEMDVKYLIVGGEVPGHESYRCMLQRTIDESDLKESFILTGMREDVPRLIGASDVMVHLPQHEDTLPGVVFEAMAMEKPVVATRSGGIPEQFEDGKSGILVDKGDTEALATALLRLLEDEELRSRMGREARLYLTTHFSPERFFSQLSSIYLELVREPPIRSKLSAG